MFRRENTFRIDHSNVPRKPPISDVHQFIGNVLGLTREQVVRLQISKSLGCAFVKTVDLATAQKVVEEHGEEHELVVDDKSYPLRITMEDGAVEVNLSDLSEGVSNSSIAQFLSNYGEVFSIQEMLWGENYHFESISSGTRIARMLVKKNIPSFVMIDSELAAVLYFGQRHTCRHCGEFVHNGVSCVINKKLLIQKLATDRSYANVAKQTQPTQSKTLPRPVEKEPKMGPPKPVPQPPKAPANPSGPSKTTEKKKQDAGPKFKKRCVPADPKAADETQDKVNDDDVPQDTATDDDESDGSVASKSSKDSRRLRKRQKTGHGVPDLPPKK